MQFQHQSARPLPAKIVWGNDPLRNFKKIEFKYEVSYIFRHVSRKVKEKLSFVWPCLCNKCFVTCWSRPIHHVAWLNQLPPPHTNICKVV